MKLSWMMIAICCVMAWTPVTAQQRDRDGGHRQWQQRQGQGARSSGWSWTRVGEGVASTAAGGVVARGIGDWLFSPKQAAPPPVVVERQVVVEKPVVVQQRVVETVETTLEPYTAAWYAYCQRRYKSFDPNTGTYMSYSGQRRFCQ
jgi:BA14K-like protein